MDDRNRNGKLKGLSTSPYCADIQTNTNARDEVIRACEMCRKRKIKCDSANTNTWPCAPCVRNQLKCQPPQPSSDADTRSHEETIMQISQAYPTPANYGNVDSFNYAVPQYTVPYGMTGTVDFPVSYTHLTLPTKRIV